MDNETNFEFRKPDYEPAVGVKELPDYVEASNYKGDPFTVAVSSEIPFVGKIGSTAHRLKIPAGTTGFYEGPLNPVETNKFYTNMLLGDRTLPVFPTPYVMWWSKEDRFKGIAVSYVRPDQRVFGPDPGANPVQYFFNPAGIRSFIFSSPDFDSSMDLTIDSMDQFTAQPNLRSKTGGWMWVPLAQGMGFATAVYFNMSPKITSAVGFRSFKQVGSPRSRIQKFEIQLEDGVNWLMYVTVPEGQNIKFTQKDGNNIVGDASLYSLVVQIAVNPSNSAGDYDRTCGMFISGANISGNFNGADGEYQINYYTQGSNNAGEPLIFALPHHVLSLHDSMKSKQTSVKLNTTVRGTAAGYISNKLVMKEKLPLDILFDPWSSIAGWSSSYTNTAKKLIAAAAAKEANEDVENLSNLDSMYFAGKKLDKYAYILWVVMYILGDKSLAGKLRDKLVRAMDRFIDNRQINPLVYDTTWKGIISTAGIWADPMLDFGNSYYNDHHFHYGYHIHAAALLAKVDGDLGGNWLNSTRRKWVDSLVRDIANPTWNDQYFPVNRSFDWYVGHSWAKGLFVSGDGKDEESSSEDYHSAYALKLWGNVTKNSALEARANLMLAVSKNSLNHYMLMANDNKVQPSQFIKNKVTGILFENKADHATYFGLNPEFIHGIHMIPITPVSSLIRGPKFVQEEWAEKISGIVNQVDSGWKGILMCNLALFDPVGSWNFFSKNFQDKWLDDGASLTWYLAYTAGVGGARGT